MRIVADPQIPLANELFGSLGHVDLVPGAAIAPGSLIDADVLLVRSVTRVDEALLAGSRVRFVGSATIGTDHVDVDYLSERGIAFAFAPGSNAESVVEYLIAALAATFADRSASLEGHVAGVVGRGNIGSLVALRLRALGMTVLWNDPPLTERGEGDADHRQLPSLLDAADVLLLHTPLTRTGPHSTWHLIGEKELDRLGEGAWVFNTSRGSVLDNRALRDLLGRGRLGGAVLDVWENEPDPDPALISMCALATPHIAGYSYDGKVGGAMAIARALATWLGKDPDPQWSAHVRAPESTELRMPPGNVTGAAWLDAVVRQMYDVRSDDERMRQLVRVEPSERVSRFHELRSSYPERRAFGWYHLPDEPPPFLRRPVVEGLRVAIGGGRVQRS